MPQFYLGANKKSVPSDGISEDERKMFGIERFVNSLRQMKKGPNSMIEHGIDVTTLGLNFGSPE